MTVQHGCCNLSSESMGLGNVMADTVTDEDFLLALLNSTPVIDGVPADDLADPVRARDWLAAAGGRGTETELRHVLRVRESLQAVVRGQQPAAVLAPELEDVTSVPAIDDGRVGWTLCVAPDRKLAVRAVLAWDALAGSGPGTAAPVRERRMPPVPHRPQQGQRRPVVLDGRLRQQDEGPPPLPAFTHLSAYRLPRSGGFLSQLKGARTVRSGRAVTGTRPVAVSAGGRVQTRRRTRPRPAPVVSRR